MNIESSSIGYIQLKKYRIFFVTEAEDIKVKADLDVDGKRVTVTDWHTPLRFVNGVIFLCMLD